MPYSGESVTQIVSAFSTSLPNLSIAWYVQLMQLLIFFMMKLINVDAGYYIVPKYGKPHKVADLGYLEA